MMSFGTAVVLGPESTLVTRSTGGVSALRSPPQVGCEGPGVILRPKAFFTISQCTCRLAASDSRRSAAAARRSVAVKEDAVVYEEDAVAEEDEGRGRPPPSGMDDLPFHMAAS